MSTADDQPTDIRITFRTHTARVEKLQRVAEAHGLRVGVRYSIGAAINYVVDNFKDERPKKTVKRRKKL